MNKKLFSTIAFLIIACTTSVFAQQGKVFTADDYARAEKMLGYSTNPLIDRGAVRPSWQADGKFWYRVPTPTASEYILVNPADGSRTAGDSLEKLGITAPANQRPGNGVVSPDGKKEAFIKEWNLWVRDLET